MDQLKVYFCGFNSFNQFQNSSDVVSSFEEVNFEKILDPPQKSIKNIIVRSYWSFTVYAIDDSLYISGCVVGKRDLIQKFKFDHSIKDVSCTETYCLTLLTTGLLYKLNLKTFEISEINSVIIQRSSTPESVNKKLKRLSSSSTLADNETERSKNDEIITYIASGRTFSVAISNKNVVYNIPLKVFTFPSHIKVKKISCGTEHCLILTTNGDLYAFGSGTRGQLGTGELESEEQPVLIEALAGIKIIDVAAGGWHSAAISAFNDLYVFGWNVNGQLGLPLHEIWETVSKSGEKIVEQRKRPTVFATPIVHDLPKNSNQSNDEIAESEMYTPMRVYAGMRHTICETEDGCVLGAGWNQYGQLVQPESQCDIDRFCAIHTPPKCSNNRIVCGDWSTIIISNS